MITLFKPYKAKKYFNNPLHIAAIEGDSAAFQKTAANEAYLKEKNSLGLTPKELSQFFNHSSLFSHGSLPMPEVEKEGKTMRYTKEEFEKHLGVTYLHQLEFSSFSTLAWIFQKCDKAGKQNLITTEQKWLGAYYAKELEDAFLPQIVIKWIDNDVGYGIFAKKNFKAKDFIGEYTGVLRKKKRRADFKNSYCFEYLIGETIDTPYTIDAQDKGNFTRFINHSNEGNCDPMIIFAGGIMRVIIYANKDIPKGSQITYDYGPDYWAKREKPQDMEPKDV
jgi:uncharacterized protein